MINSKARNTLDFIMRDTKKFNNKEELFLPLQNVSRTLAYLLRPVLVTLHYESHQNS